MSRFHVTSRLVPAALVALLAVGCSEMPTQPAVDSTTPGLQGMRAMSDPARIVPPPPTDNPLSSQSSARIFGHKGGQVTAGMFTAVIPPGAFSGFATVTIRQPDINQPVAVLEISPASKNGFDEPVLLIARMPNVDASLLMQTELSELDEASGQWLAMNGELANAMTMTLTTPLMHFSTYRVEFPTPGTLTGGGTSGGGGGDPGKQTSIHE
jgi:hypothetical protein